MVTNGFGFVPIIFESSGDIHDQSKRFLQVSVKKAMETRKINWNKAYAYLVKRLSVTLQKVIAQNVNKRLIKLSSHSSSMVSQDPAFHYEVMMDEELLVE